MIKEEMEDRGKKAKSKAGFFDDETQVPKSTP
jgi:hypothetical protein